MADEPTFLTEVENAIEFSFEEDSKNFEFNSLYEEFAAHGIVPDKLQSVFKTSKRLKDALKVRAVKLSFSTKSGKTATFHLHHAPTEANQFSHKRFMACVARYMLETQTRVKLNPLASSMGIPDDHEAYTVFVSGYEFLASSHPAIVSAIARKLLKMKANEEDKEKDKDFSCLCRQTVGKVSLLTWISENKAEVEAKAKGLPDFTREAPKGSVVGH